MILSLLSSYLGGKKREQTMNKNSAKYTQKNRFLKHKKKKKRIRENTKPTHSYTFPFPAQHCRKPRKDVAYISCGIANDLKISYFFVWATFCLLSLEGQCKIPFEVAPCLFRIVLEGPPVAVHRSVVYLLLLCRQSPKNPLRG